jgi:hypothetical protein
MTQEIYLLQMEFPDAHEGFGPGVRAGDFGEILVADYIQYRLGYVVPRTRYRWRENRSVSTQGVDVLGFLQQGDLPSRHDRLMTFEVKCALGKTSRNRRTLRDAVSDSEKDFKLRKAESLNAMSQKLRAMGRDDERALVRRFQPSNAHPYTETSGAAAVHSTENFDEEVVLETHIEGHPNAAHLMLIVIHGRDLMLLVHALYERAADES